MIILMIDDVRSNLDLYQRILRPIKEAEFVSFISSSNALAWAQEFDPDVVLVDYKMPAPDGLEFIKQFRKLPGKDLTPIVMITAARDRGVCQRAYKLGANDFLTSPADPIELEARIRNMLTLRECHPKR